MRFVHCVLPLAALVLMCRTAFADDTGVTAFKRCAPCHEVGPGAKSKIGPALNGLDGRLSGSVAGFSFSAANKAARITWNEAAFLAYIKDPQARIPGTKKTFGGIRDESEAKALWVYLKAFAADGQPK